MTEEKMNKSIKQIREAIIKPKLFVYFILVFCIISGFLKDELGFPSSIFYCLDISSLCLFFCLICYIGKGKKISWVIPKPVLFILILFSLSVIFGVILNYQSLVSTLYGIRTIFRFLLFFISCCCFLDIRDLKTIMNIFFILQILNFFIAMYQYFVLHFHEDSLGGIFGYGNGPVLNIFQGGIVLYFLLLFLTSKKHLLKFFFVCVSSLFVAGLAEEKAFFFYFFIIVIFSFCLTKFYLSKFLMLCFMGLILFVGLNVLSAVNSGDTLSDLFNVEKQISYANNSYGISRINPFSDINYLFFKDDPGLYLFGFGLGNCEFSASSNLEFYHAYSYTNYNFFSHAYLLLSTGYLGYILFSLFILVSGLYGLFRKEKNIYSIFSFTFSIILIISMSFAPSLIINQGYLCYFFLSVFCISYKIELKKRSSKNNGNYTKSFAMYSISAQA